MGQPAGSARFGPTSYIVQKTDGTLLMCARSHEFEHLRNGPCVLGSDGSIALFVTDRRLPGETDWTARDVRNPVLGLKMTYVPVSEIAEIRFTLPTKVSASALPLSRGVRVPQAPKRDRGLLGELHPS